MFKIIALVAVLLIVGLLLIFAATKPNTFRVQRSAGIKSTPDKIFPLINDLHSWGAWSPWEKMDPGMRKVHSGAAQGTGAVYEWEGNSKVGKGRMEISDTSPPSKVVIALDFIKPFQAHNMTEFTLEPRGGATDVTWAMHGPTPYTAKIMHIFVSMDSMVGKQFETGLANLKALAET